MIDPEFDPLNELELHARVLQNQQYLLDKLIEDHRRLDGLIKDLSENQMKVTELLVKNNNSIKWALEEIEMLQNATD